MILNVHIFCEYSTMQTLFTKFLLKKYSLMRHVQCSRKNATTEQIVFILPPNDNERIFTKMRKKIANEFMKNTVCFFWHQGTIYIIVHQLSAFVRKDISAQEENFGTYFQGVLARLGESAS